jgi:hypothetical protein
MKLTKRTLFKQGIRLAMQTTVFVAMAASAAGAEGGQKIGPTASTNSQAQSSTISDIANDKPLWERKTDSAYLTAFAYHCAPGMLDQLAGAVAPNSIEVAIYTDRLRVDYEGDCRAFYLNEVAARIDPPTLQAVRDSQLQ